MKPIGTSILNLGRIVALPLISLSLAAPAVAQSDPMLEEIVVVAQKREENIMDVPVAITAVTGAQIEASGIKDMLDLQLNVPGLIVGGSQTTTTSNFSIRGLGSTANNFGVESSVGLYVDGVYRSRQSSMINDLVDIQAVEVLRGPQGTLFGKNTAAGAINVRTVAPSLDSRDAFFEVTAGDLDLMRITGGMNFALTDEVAFRATFFSSQRDGYVANHVYDYTSPIPSITVQDNLFNNRDRFGVRLQALYDNGENFNLRVIADYSEIDEYCCIGTSRVDGLLSHGALQQGIVAPGPDFLRLLVAEQNGQGGITYTDFPYGSFGVDLPPLVRQGVSWDDYITTLNRPPVSQNEDSGLSLEMNWELDNGMTVTSVTAFRAFDTFDHIDADFTDTLLAERTNDAAQDSISQELRLSGTFGEGSNWVVGAYYFAQEIESNTFTVGGSDLQAFGDLGWQFSEDLQELGAAFGFQDVAEGPLTMSSLAQQVSVLSALTNGYIAPGAPSFPEGAFANDDVTQEHDGFAVFGQVDWAISDALKLTLGARYTEETKDIRAIYTQTNPGGEENLFLPEFDFLFPALLEWASLYQWIGAGQPPEAAPPINFLNRVAAPNSGWAAWTLPPFAPRPNVIDKLDDDQVTGTAKLTWFINDSMMAYASYATGFKSGGTNTDRIEYDWTDPDNPLFSQLFDAEKSTSMELGFKGDIGNNFRLSMALYQTDFDDFQANTFEGSGFILRNAGELEIKGVEIEWLWQALENTTISGYYAHNEGEYITFPLGIAWDATPFHSGRDQDGNPLITDSGDRSGEALPYNPEDRYMLALTQDFPMGNNNMFLRAEYIHASEATTDGDNDPLTLQDDFGILNLRVGVEIADWNSTITLWGRNITDERYYNGSFDPPLLDFGRMNSYPSEVATYGITFRKNWD
jgi:outer membrane receptor protein involved in Fe transport